jgi:hypothetical protein
MKRQVILTVAASKRLIAKGVAAMPLVKKAMKDGMVVVSTGTTNAYVLEELWGRKIDKRRYRSGITTPKTPDKMETQQDKPIPDKVFRKGEVAEELNRYNAVEHMGKSDVFIKGANALDYNGKMAGVLIGGNSGGTLGAVLGNVIGRKINLVIPVGLEKLVNKDMNELQRLASSSDYEGPGLWPITGIIVTEIEALNILTGVDTTLLSSGGIAGAEGSVRLLLDGTEKKVNDALDLVGNFQEEPRYLL